MWPGIVPSRCCSQLFQFEGPRHSSSIVVDITSQDLALVHATLTGSTQTASGSYVARAVRAAASDSESAAAESVASDGSTFGPSDTLSPSIPIPKLQGGRPCPGGRCTSRVQCEGCALMDWLLSQVRASLRVRICRGAVVVYVQRKVSAIALLFYVHMVDFMRPRCLRLCRLMEPDMTLPCNGSARGSLLTSLWTNG